MKFISLILIAILAVFYAILSLVSSSEEYAAEKLFYRAGKTYDKISVNPDVAPPQMLASLERDLSAITEKYPETNLSKFANLKLGEAYIADNKSDEALKALDAFIASDIENSPLLGKARFLKAMAYEKKGEWNSALKEFAILRKKYPNTLPALQAPIYIANYYLKNNMSVEAEAEYRKAITFYDDIERQNRGTMAGYTASGLLIQVYLGLKDYENAGKTVEGTIINYPSVMTLVQLLPYVEMIFVNELKRPKKAIDIYHFIRDRSNDKKLREVLWRKIKELEETLEEKSLK